MTSGQLDQLYGADLAVTTNTHDHVSVLLSLPTLTGDCDGDGIPDACESDCDADGTPDECQANADCDMDGIADRCEPDCDGDGVPDDCETDCNGNGNPDDCDIAEGRSDDDNGNGTPDECDGEAVTVNDNYDDLSTVAPASSQSSWEPWDNNPVFDAYATTAAARSVPNSLRIAGTDQMVHNLGAVTSGSYTITAWQYIPTGFTSNATDSLAGSYFNLLSVYEHGGPHHWAVRMQFDSNDGMLKVFNGPGLGTNNTPYLLDTWVEIRCEVDVGADWVQVFYQGTMMAEYSWAAGILGDGGAQELGAMSFEANGASSVYYDDVTLVINDALATSLPPARPPLLERPRPNPFSSEIAIRYSVRGSQEVRVTIHDIRGAEVVTLFQGQESDGQHTRTWNGRDGRGRLVGSGVFFVVVQSGVERAVRRVTLVK
jgi:hypothetical protein